MDIIEQQEKRQRLTVTSEKRALKLEGLPHPILTEIASYLLTEAHNPSRTTGGDTLLAVALTASKSSWDKLQYDDTTDINKLLSPASKAVLLMHTDDWGKRFEEFNFYHDMQLDFGSTNMHKLDDIVLKAILICIDARNNVKSLKLTGDVPISGRGLEPLAGSSVIGRIDLSLERVYTNSYGNLCEGIVLPILHSIIEGDSSSLRHIQLPVKWRKDKSTELTRFMEVYNDHLRDSARPCQHEWKEGGVQRKCGNECGLGMHEEGERYGIQTATCYQCMKNFCSEARCIDGFDYCPECQKYHCIDCKPIYNCFGSGCQKSSCQDCHGVLICDRCSDSYCSDCKFVGICGGCLTAVCDDCGLNFCSCCEDCFCEECGDDFTKCKMCEEYVCNGCLHGTACEGCYDSGLV